MTDDSGCRPWWQNALMIAGAVALIAGVVALSVATGGAAGAVLLSVAYAGAAGATTGYVAGSIAGYRSGGWQGALDGAASGCLFWTADFMTAEMGAQIAGALISRGLSYLSRSMRTKLLNKVVNKSLRNCINEMFREGANIGNGGLADAIRYEKNTGKLVGGKSHIQKGWERVSNLRNIIKNNTLNSSDKNIAQSLLNDLLDALGGK